MSGTFEVWQIVLLVLLFLGTCITAFFAYSTQKRALVYAVIFLLGLMLVVMFSNLFLSLAIAVFTVGVCLLYHGHASKSLLKMGVGIGIFLVGIVLFFVIKSNLTLDEDELSLRRNLYDIAQYERLGALAAEKYPGAEVVAVVPPNMSERQKKQLEAFEKKYGSAVTVVEEKQFDSQAFREENADLNSKRYQAKMDAEMAACSLPVLFQTPALRSADVVLMVTAMPSNKQECLRLFKVLTKMKKKVSLLIPHGSTGSATQCFAPYIKAGKIGAIVLMNVNSSISADVPENPEEVFDSRYVLVTSENIDTLQNDRNYKVMLVDDDDEE